MSAALEGATLFLHGKGGNKLMHATPGSRLGSTVPVSVHPEDKLHEMSSDGTKMCVVETSGLRVLCTSTGRVLFDRPMAFKDGVRALAFSPLGTFLLTWEKLKEGAEHGNLRIYNISSGALECSFAQKLLGEKSAWPAVRWSDDELVACRMVTNEIHFYDGKAPQRTPTQKLRVERVAQFALAPSGGKGEGVALATFVPEHQGAPAVVRIWRYPDFGEGRFLTSKTFFKASEVELRWSPSGGGLLVQTHTEVDRSGKSYYGESGLHYMGVKGEVFRVALSKEGPVHDVQWSPRADEFIALFGTSPPKAAIFDTQCKQTHDFGEGARNTVRWAPHGRSFILGGFGNLSGELSFWDRKTLKCLNTVDAHMTTVHEWSPDSRAFLTGILWPRLRVDNGYKLWSPSGEILHQEKIEELSIAAWLPSPASAFDPPDDSYYKQIGSGASSRPAAAAKYVPPSQRGAAGAAGGARVAGGMGLAALCAQVERGGSMAMRSGGPLGAEPSGPPGAEGATGASAKNAAKAKAKKAAAAKKKAAEEGGADAAPAAAAAPADEGELTTEKLDKKIRNVEKKLRQIAELRELKAGGKPLEANQVKKIDAEAEVKDELVGLQRMMTELLNKPKDTSGNWR